MSKNISVFGLYTTEANVAECVDQLRLAGFRNTDISALFSENSGNKDLAHEKNTKAPEGAMTGVGSGAILGGAFGWLAGIGLLAMPGLGLFVAAGPIMGLLSGVGVGATIGALTGALIGSGIPEYEAKRYKGRVRKAGILLSVHCDDADLENRAQRILKNTGAQGVSASSEAKADFGASDQANPRSTGSFSRRQPES